jgi:hypothetical protein
MRGNLKQKWITYAFIDFTNFGLKKFTEFLHRGIKAFAHFDDTNIRQRRFIQKPNVEVDY